MAPALSRAITKMRQLGVIRVGEWPGMRLILARCWNGSSCATNGERLELTKLPAGKETRFSYLGCVTASSVM